MERISLSDILQDLGLVGLSIGLALVLASSGALHHMFAVASDMWIIGAFVAGIFFTSVFTAAPAVAVVILVAEHHSPGVVAVVAAVGSLLGDYVMFVFARDRFSRYIRELLTLQLSRERLRAVMHLRLFRWTTFLVGALIIASPLPDELGVALLGFSRVDTAMFAPLSFIANLIGLYVIASLA